MAKRYLRQFSVWRDCDKLGYVVAYTRAEAARRARSLHGRRATVTEVFI